MNRLLFFSTLPHDCNYLEDELAVSVVADPRAEFSPEVYGRLIDLGFRRSGSNIYAPHCPNCRACTPTRVPVNRFSPNRSQRRSWTRNQDLEVRCAPAGYSEEYFTLYERYLRERHPGGGMDDPTPESFREFLYTDWCETVFLEFRQGEKLLGVAVTDILPQGLSATYTFFDPEEGIARGLGSYAILRQIEEARQRDLAYLYMGYWVADCDKMSYKTRFQPIEGLIDGQWETIRRR